MSWSISILCCISTLMVHMLIHIHKYGINKYHVYIHSFIIISRQQCGVSVVIFVIYKSRTQNNINTGSLFIILQSRSSTIGWFLIHQFNIWLFTESWTFKSFHPESIKYGSLIGHSNVDIRTYFISQLCVNLWRYIHIKIKYPLRLFVEMLC